jgi:hypothetical protein
MKVDFSLLLDLALELKQPLLAYVSPFLLATLIYRLHVPILRRKLREKKNYAFIILHFCLFLFCFCENAKIYLLPFFGFSIAPENKFIFLPQLGALREILLKLSHMCHSAARERKT